MGNSSSADDGRSPSLMSRVSASRIMNVLSSPANNKSPDQKLNPRGSIQINRISLAEYTPSSKDCGSDTVRTVADDNSLSSADDDSIDSTEISNDDLAQGFHSKATNIASAEFLTRDQLFDRKEILKNLDAKTKNHEFIRQLRKAEKMKQTEMNNTDDPEEVERRKQIELLERERKVLRDKHLNLMSSTFRTNPNILVSTSPLAQSKNATNNNTRNTPSTNTSMC